MYSYEFSADCNMQRLGGVSHEYYWHIPDHVMDQMLW